MENISDYIQFDDYKEYMKYVYKTLLDNGQLSAVIELVKTQKSGKPFNYEFNTKEGVWSVFALNLQLSLNRKPCM